jgi:hypothetical protein
VSATLAPPHEALENFLRNEAPLCRDLSGYDGKSIGLFLLFCSHPRLATQNQTLTRENHAVVLCEVP